MSLCRAFIHLIVALTPVVAAAAQHGPSNPSQEQWRQEYNEVAAAIDTLIRLYGNESLERLTRSSRVQQPGSEDPLVLLFWADDEAEVFLNGYPVGRTRLTPTQIDIPRFYLEDDNVLRVHCWDTDSVESGFMAGLYLPEPGGGLRPVILTTDEFKWQAKGAQAQEIFYTHSIPDIPGAKVIWGNHLFGELWLQKEFTREAVSIGSKSETVLPPPGVERRPMEFHQVVSRLVSLEARLDQIERELAGWKARGAFPRYKGRGAVGSIAAFTLGRAAPLKESTDIRASERLQSWTKALPSRARELVLQPERHLKGWKNATAAVLLGDDSSADAHEDRRTNYQPPPEISTGTHAAYVQRGTDPSTRLSLPASPTWIGVSTLILFAYVASASWQWWRLFTSAEWT